MFDLVHLTIGRTALKGLAGVALALGLAPSVMAQVYFVATRASAGSLSAPGQATPQVYLRWDAIEGALPDGIASFELHRDGAPMPMAALPASGVMSAQEIEALYAGPEQARRLIELLPRLQAQLDAVTDGVAPVVDSANFAGHLSTQLADAPAFAGLLARFDPNVAVATFRGHIDPSPAGAHTYELFANLSQGGSVKLGESSVGAGTSAPLAAAADLAQVTELGRCDVPAQRARSHQTIALRWRHAGDTAGEQALRNLTTIGFDLYRSVAPAALLAPRDLRAEAAALAHASDGSVPFAGLERVTENPIPVAGDVDLQTLNEGWNPPAINHLETADEVRAAGMAPGELRAYYVVPRDFTGNYGETTALLVQVPDLDAPPPPWRVTTQVRRDAGVLALVFDQVDVPNYYASYSTGREYCNLNTARFERELRYVDDAPNCELGIPIRVPLDVEDYLIYRFASSDRAGHFTDADGDGFADRDERSFPYPNPLLSAPGTACDAAAGPGGGASNHLVGTVSAASFEALPSGRRTVEFADPVPAGDPDLVHWYRIASRDADGNIGPLSVPARGHFRTVARPEQCGSRGPRLTEEECAPAYGVEPITGPSNVPLQDASIDEAAKAVALSCANPGDGPLDRVLPIAANTPPAVPRGAMLDQSTCITILNTCSGDYTARFRDGAGAVLGQSGTLNVAGLGAQCIGFNGARLNGGELVCSARPVAEGDSVHGILRPNCEAAPKHCVQIFRRIGDRNFRYRTFCPPEVPELDPADIATTGTDLVCLSIAVADENNLQSTPIHLPCFNVDRDIPPPPVPTPVSIVFAPDSSDATLNWLPPQTPVLGTILEWSQEGADDTVVARSFIGHPDTLAADGALNHDIDVGAEPAGTDWQEEWCFRARSVARQGGDSAEQRLSAWSPLRCGLRQPAAASLPPSIPWPKTPEATQLGTLAVQGFDDNILIALSPNPLEPGPTMATSCVIEATPTAQGELFETFTWVQCPGMCDAIRGNVGLMLGFVVYRQSASDALDPSTYRNYVQASPLIDKAWCESRPPSAQHPFGQEVLADPHIRLFAQSGVGSPWNDRRLVLEDRYPFASGRSYRYQLVYFDSLGEVVGVRNTEWVQAP